MLGDDQNLQTFKDELVHAVIAFDKFRLLVQIKGTGPTEECRNCLTN